MSGHYLFPIDHTDLGIPTNWSNYGNLTINIRLSYPIEQYFAITRVSLEPEEWPAFCETIKLQTCPDIIYFLLTLKTLG